MGKVHGSLARAGKVKSQTPKVRFLHFWMGLDDLGGSRDGLESKGIDDIYCDGVDERNNQVGERE